MSIGIYFGNVAFLNSYYCYLEINYIKQQYKLTKQKKQKKTTKKREICIALLIRKHDFFSAYDSFNDRNVKKNEL